MKDSATQALFQAPPPINLSTPRVRHYLQHCELEKLLVEELGWDRHAATLEIPIDGYAYTLRGFAEKRGVQIFLCMPDGEGRIPDYATRRKIEKKATKAAYEHLIIYIDRDKSTQVWQWVSRQPGLPVACREHTYHPGGQSGDSLIRKLQSIAIPLNEEEAIDLTGAVHKLRDAFDRDRVTKRFYDHFKREHAAFLTFVKGIIDKGDAAWYASLMLNRLMFIYFIQEKCFLDGDPKYLTNRLKAVQARKGKGKFHTFYRYFLRVLFQEGFNKRAEARRLDPDLRALLGEVPFLNGGLFELHELERKYPDIDVPDEAFANIFAFFGQYDWTLDNRPLRNDREINPDVLGYIFEKYINQKQMGAYYTKEDITGYIGRNTIIPCLFDSAQKKCAVAFQTDSALWRMLRDDPDRYIYPAMRRGVIDASGVVIPESVLPDFVQKGMLDPKARMFNREYNLRQAFIPDEQGANLALPTETWREYATRRARCLEIRGKLAKGEIREINDLITYNLDIRQFAEDAVVAAEGPELLRAFWQAIAGKIPERSNERYETGLTILDPTCGSGAFLFAALNILEPLYEACLERMQAFVDDLERSGEHHAPRKFEDFRKILADVERHPNRSYFILKSIIVNNLYGVDIMEEAVEICKLRLFLKLVAQIDRVKELEPLPDIDFNIRAGNTLVGFVSLEEIRSSAEKELTGQHRLIFGEAEDAIRRIDEEAKIVDRAFRLFHQMQTEYSMDAAQFAQSKQDLRGRLKNLTEQLDRYLAAEYGIELKKTKEYDRWRKSHQPFHWFAEFYGIMSRGGFDVIIGNPPYIVFSESTVGYKLKPEIFKTFECKNLYGYVFEQSLAIASRQAAVGLIVQLTAMSAEKMTSLQDILLNRGRLFCLAFPRRPESMFDGVEMPVVIQLSLPGASILRTSRISRFYTEERPFAVNTISLHEHSFKMHGHRIAKLGNHTASSVFARAIRHKATVENITASQSEHLLYYQEACRYWVKASKGYPHFKRNGKAMPPPHGRVLAVLSESACSFAACLMNSSLFYWWYSTLSDCEHINDSLVRRMPIPDDWGRERWIDLWTALSKSLRDNAMPKCINTRQGHKIEYLEMNAALSKTIIDGIDQVLAKHYGFTAEELDFIINYDIKYRMGQNGQDDETPEEA